MTILNIISLSLSTLDLIYASLPFSSPIFPHFLPSPLSPLISLNQTPSTPSTPPLPIIYSLLVIQKL